MNINPRIVDTFGNSLNTVSVDQQVQISADLANGQDREQVFAYLIQIQNDDNVPTSLGWITGSLTSGQSFSPSLSWIPDTVDSYITNLYILDDLTNMNLLSPPLKLSIEIDGNIEEINTTFEEPTFSQSDTLTVSLSDDSLSTGDSIVISGKVPNIADIPSVNLMIVSPNDQLVYVSVSEVTNSNYSFDLKTGGIMDVTGNYEVKVNFGYEKITENFYFDVSDDNTGEPTPSTFTVKTDQTHYDAGDFISISGFIENLADYVQSVTLVIFSPEGDIVTLAQVIPSSDGHFSTSMNAGGAMTLSGIYEVRAQYGAQKVTSTFVFTGGDNISEPQPTPEPISISVHSSSPSYEHGDNIVISGLVQNFVDSNTSVIIVIKSPDKNIVSIASAIPNSDGSYSTTIKAGGTMNSSGSYEVKVEYGTAKATNTFYYSDGESEPIPNPLPSSIVVTTDKSFYSENETIFISGEVRDLYSGTPVSVIVKAPDGNLVSIAQVEVVADKKFSTQLDAGGALMKIGGAYIVEARYGTESRSASTSFEFRGDEEPNPQPTPDPIKINVKTDRNSYHLGGNLKITGTIKPTDGSTVLLQLYSSSGNLVYDDRVSPSSNGVFTTQIKLAGSDYRDTGIYTVKAISKSVSGKAEFLLKTSNPVPDTGSSSTSISIPQGTATPSCEDTNSCFLPYEVKINTNGEVTWYNHDTAAHTVTSGSPAEGPNGIFDSSLMMTNSSFSYVFTNSGVYDYFCMVHPWMTGIILVGEGTTPTPQPNNDIDLEITVERRVYDINTIAVLDISLTGNTNSQNVAIEIMDPRGTTIVSRSVSIDPDGNKFFEFRIDNDAKTGNYRVTATTSDGNKTIKNTAYFKVKSTIQFI